MKTYELKTYMAYSRCAGAPEAAILVFAHNVREAKRVGWYSCGDFIDVYTDLAVNLLKEPQLYENADQAKLVLGIPHVIDSPRSCKDCETWGYYLNDEGICEDCEQEIEDQRLTEDEVEASVATAHGCE